MSCWEVYRRSRGHLFWRLPRGLETMKTENGEYVYNLQQLIGGYFYAESSSDKEAVKIKRIVPEALIGQSLICPTSCSQNVHCLSLYSPPSVTMMAPMPPFTPGLSRRDTARAVLGHEHAGSIPPPPLTGGGAALGPQSAGVIYQHIHDMSTKRISTFDYLRKA